MKEKINNWSFWYPLNIISTTTYESGLKNFKETTYNLHESIAKMQGDYIIDKFERNEFKNKELIIEQFRTYKNFLEHGVTIIIGYK